MAQRKQAMPAPSPEASGYEFEVMELGQPEYFTPSLVANSRGKPIPMGDGEGLPYRPAPDITRPRRSRRRSEGQFAALRRWVRDQVAELRSEIEQLKAVAEYAELRTTVEEF